MDLVDAPTWNSGFLGSGIFPPWIIFFFSHGNFLRDLWERIPGSKNPNQNSRGKLSPTGGIPRNSHGISFPPLPSGHPLEKTKIPISPKNSQIPGTPKSQFWLLLGMGGAGNLFFGIRKCWKSLDKGPGKGTKPHPHPTGIYSHPCQAQSMDLAALFPVFLLLLGGKEEIHKFPGAKIRWNPGSDGSDGAGLENFPSRHSRG